MKISNYLMKNKLYLKEKISIECAVYYGNGTHSYNHEWVELEDYIDIVDIIENGFIFKSSGSHKNIIANKKSKYNTKSSEDYEVQTITEFIYWCDINIFLDMRCKKIVDIREDKLKELGL